MSLTEHARIELELAGFFKEDGFYGDMLGKAVMELMEVFADQGHSGMSASVASGLFHTLADYKPLGPLTGEDDEWADVEHIYQNKRCSAVFKDKETGESHYIDAIIWKEENGACFSGSSVATPDGYSLGSAQTVKFPFTPKTFYIDVISTEVAKDDWESRVKDMDQLKEVFEYYTEKRR